MRQKTLTQKAAPIHTMADLAQLTGVSKMTISRVFTDPSRVRPATKAKVLAAATKLGYEYNALAGNFSSGRTGLIGVAVEVGGLMGSSYFSRIFKAAHGVLEDAGYRAMILDLASKEFSDGDRLSRLVSQRRVDGLLAFVPPQNQQDFLLSFSQKHTSIVLVGGRCAVPEVPWLALDNHHAVELLMRHLAGLGHTKIAFISGYSGVNDSIERQQAFHSVRLSLNLKWRPEWEQCGDFSWGGGRRAMSKILTSAEPPTAVVAANDFSGLGACDLLRSKGLTPGRQISVTGIDGMDLAGDADPALTTVLQPLETMGQMAATILLERLKETPLQTGGHGRLLLGSLIARPSTGPAPTP
ncbi:MAG: LacI family DNA-binding transcriptional regulator [Verrucomicrobiota bacterium]